jgi:hypothetical protein
VNQHNTLVILGNYDGTRHIYNQAREDCDVWVFNEMMGKTNPDQWVKRADAVFQMHVEPIWRNPANRTDPGHYDWLKSNKEIPVYMQERYPDVPMSQKYPLEEIKFTLLRNFAVVTGGKRRKNVFSSTISYALALGIYKGYSKIETYGIELGTETEFFHQRENFTFWCGVAVGRGIQVECYTDFLMNAPLYGYEGEVTLAYDVFVQRRDELRGPTADAMEAYNQAKTHTLAIAERLRNDTATMNEFIEASREQVTRAVEFGLHDGALQENDRYIRKADTMKEASGGSFVFSRQEFESAKKSMIERHAKDTLGAAQSATRLQLMCETVVRTKNKKHRSTRIDQLIGVLEEYVQANTGVAVLAGAIGEDERYLNRLDAGIRAAGGAKSEAVLLGEAAK